MGLKKLKRSLAKLSLKKSAKTPSSHHPTKVIVHWDMRQASDPLSSSSPSPNSNSATLSTPSNSSSPSPPTWRAVHPPTPALSSVDEEDTTTPSTSSPIHIRNPFTDYIVSPSSLSPLSISSTLDAEDSLAMQVIHDGVQNPNTLDAHLPPRYRIQHTIQDTIAQSHSPIVEVVPTPPAPFYSTPEAQESVDCSLGSVVARFPALPPSSEGMLLDGERAATPTITTTQTSRRTSGPPPTMPLPPAPRPKTIRLSTTRRISVFKSDSMLNQLQENPSLMLQSNFMDTLFPVLRPDNHSQPLQTPFSDFIPPVPAPETAALHSPFSQTPPPPPTPTLLPVVSQAEMPKVCDESGEIPIAEEGGTPPTYPYRLLRSFDDDEASALLLSPFATVDRLALERELISCHGSFLRGRDTLLDKESFSPDMASSNIRAVSLDGAKEVLTPHKVFKCLLPPGRLAISIPSTQAKFKHDSGCCLPSASASIRAWSTRSFCDASSTASAPSRIPELSDFHFLRQIGKGGFGVVYLALDTISRQRLAIKIVEKKPLNEKMLRRTQNECAILRKLQGKGKEDVIEGVVRLQASWHDTKYYYFAMDYYPTDVQRELDRCGSFDDFRARFYMAEIISGLTAIHKHGVIHRDIKASNLLLNSLGHITIADFGLARDFRRIPTLPERVFQPFWPYLPSKDINPNEKTPKRHPFELHFTAWTWCGSVWEAAPEMYKGEVYSFGVDFWSAAIVGFWMHVGEPPFWRRDKFSPSVKEQVLIWPLLWLRSDHLGAEVKDFYERMLRKDPKHRLKIELEIPYHPYFAGFDWEAFERREVPAPWIPGRSQQVASRAREERRPMKPIIPGKLYSPQDDPCPQFWFTLDAFNQVHVEDEKPSFGSLVATCGSGENNPEAILKFKNLKQAIGEDEDNPFVNVLSAANKHEDDNQEDSMRSKFIEKGILEDEDVPLAFIKNSFTASQKSAFVYRSARSSVTKSAGIPQPSSRRNSLLPPGAFAPAPNIQQQHSEDPFMEGFDPCAAHRRASDGLTRPYRLCSPKRPLSLPCQNPSNPLRRPTLNPDRPLSLPGTAIPFPVRLSSLPSTPRRSRAPRSSSMRLFVRQSSISSNSPRRSNSRPAKVKKGLFSKLKDRILGIGYRKSSLPRALPVGP